MSKPRVIDFHVHLCRTAADESRVYPRPGWPTEWYWANEGKLSDYLTFWGIDHIVVPNIMDTQAISMRRSLAAQRDGVEIPSQESLQSEMQDRVHRFNLWLLELAEREARIVPYVMGDPVLFGPGIADELQDAISRGARGVKMHPNICRHFPNDPRAMAIYRFCESRGIPILTDTTGETTDGVAWGAPAGWAEVLSTFPDLKVVLAHLPGERWDEMIDLAEHFSNCWFDIAGGFVDPSHPASTHRRMPIEEAARVIRRVGVERVFFGSDAPAHGREIPDAVAQLLQLELTGAEKEAILFDNANAFLGAWR